VGAAASPMWSRAISCGERGGGCGTAPAGGGAGAAAAGAAAGALAGAAPP